MKKEKYKIVSKTALFLFLTSINALGQDDSTNIYLKDPKTSDVIKLQADVVSCKNGTYQECKDDNDKIISYNLSLDYNNKVAYFADLDWLSDEYHQDIIRLWSTDDAICKCIRKSSDGALPQGDKSNDDEIRLILGSRCY